MWKGLAILAVVLAVAQALVPVSGQTSNNDGSKRHSNHNQTTNSQTQARQIPPVIPKPPTSGQPQNEPDNKASTNTQDSVTITEFGAVSGKRDWIDYATLGLTFLLALITGAGVIAAWRSLPAFINQAAAAKDAAEASLTQANHTIASERAWVLMLREKTQKPYLLPVERQQQRLSHCVLWLKNFGRSPAQVAYAKFELQIGERGKVPNPEIFNPQNLDFDKTPLIMPPDEDWPMEAQLANGEGIIREARVKAITEAKTEYLWLCGVICYRVVIGTDGQLHQTNVCLFYETLTSGPEPYWVLGPAEYNTAS